MLTDKELEEIRRKMLELEEEPPTDGWKNIRVEVQPPDKDWRPIGWFGVVILLLITTIGAYFLLTHEPATVPEKPVQKQAISGTEHPGAISGISQPKNGAVAVPVRSESTLPDSGGSSQTIKPEEAVQPGPAPQEQREEPQQNRNSVAHKPEQTETAVVLVPVEGDGPQDEHLAGADDTAPQEEGLSKAAIAVQQHRIGVEGTVLQDLQQNENLPGAETAQENAAAQAGMLKSVMPDLAGEKGFVLPDSVSTVLPSDENNTAKPVAAAESEKVKQKKEWYLGLTVAPRYAFRSFKPATADEVYITNLSNRKRLDPDRMGYEYGVSIGTKLRRQLFLETSLSFMQLRENVAYSYTVGEVDTVLRSVTDNGTVKLTPVYKEVERQLKSSYAYGGLRVGLTYFFLERAQSRFNITAAAGVNLLVKGRTEEYIDGDYYETIIFPSKENILEQSNYNLLVGAGYNLTLRNKYELMLMPTLNYFLGSTFHEREPFGLRPYTLGLSFQVRRSFNR